MFQELSGSLEAYLGALKFFLRAFRNLCYEKLVLV
jgi:hypothetical protein